MLTERDLIDPKEETIDGLTFIIGHVPAFEADSLYDKIIANNGVTPDDVKNRLLAHVIYKSNQGPVNFDSVAIVNNYIKNWATLRKLINKCVDVNFIFLDGGANSQN